MYQPYSQDFSVLWYICLIPISYFITNPLLLHFTVQLDKSPTVGSIECSDHKRRALATKSLTTNLHDSNFCDLFPELVKVSHTRFSDQILHANLTLIYLQKIKTELDGKKSREGATSSRKRESQTEMYLSDSESDSFSE